MDKRVLVTITQIRHPENEKMPSVQENGKNSRVETETMVKMRMKCFHRPNEATRPASFYLSLFTSPHKSAERLRRFTKCFLSLNGRENIILGRSQDCFRHPEARGSDRVGRPSGAAVHAESAIHVALRLSFGPPH